MALDPGSDHEQLEEQLAKRLSERDLQVLLHVFEDSTQSVEHYFGVSPPSPKNRTGLIKALARDHTEASQEFLNRRENEFSPSDIETNTTIDYIVETFELDRDLAERTSEDFSSLLTLIYLLMYDNQKEELSAQYESLVALATIFKGNNETIYYHDEDIPLENIETKVSAYIRNANRGSDRPRTVRKYGSADAVVLKTFAETSETLQSVFSCRRDGSDPPLTPTVTHEPRFNVKTIRIKAENVEGRGKITLSKSTNGWREDLKTLFKYAFEISGGVDALSKKELNGATQVLDTALEVAKADNKDESDVTESIRNELDTLQKEALERMKSEGVSDDKLDRAQARYEEIEFIGIRVHSDEDTHMAEFVLRSSDEFEDVTDEVDDMDAGITALLAKADAENIRLIFRTTDIDGKTQEEFEVGYGKWIARGRGVPEEAIEMLDKLFEIKADPDE